MSSEGNRTEKPAEERWGDGSGGENKLSVENRKGRVRQGQDGAGKTAKDKDRHSGSGNNHGPVKTSEFHLSSVGVCSFGRYLCGVYFLELSNINLLSVNY